jgi:hypothetical protein
MSGAMSAFGTLAPVALLHRHIIVIAPNCYSDVEPQVARNEKHDDNDTDDVKNIHCKLRIEASVISI